MSFFRSGSTSVKRGNVQSESAPPERQKIKFVINPSELCAGNTESYTTFLSEIEACDPYRRIYDAKVLKKYPVDYPRKFIDVELSNYDRPNETMTVVLNTTDLYVLAYHVNNIGFHFNDVEPELVSKLFPRSSLVGSAYKVGFKMDYRSLGRDNCHLGFHNLHNSVLSLLKGNDKKVSLLTIVQMVSEACRFHTLRTTILSNCHTSFKLSDAEKLLQNYWSDNSEAMKKAFQRGTSQNLVGQDLVATNNVSDISVIKDMDI